MSNSVFQPVVGEGWARGLGNLLRGELRSWWGTRKWWSLIIIWALAINGILFIVTLGMREEAMSMTDDALFELVMIYNIFSGIFAAIGVIVLMQSSVVGEKHSGTAAWVLSKPASRTAFILAKLVANALGVLVTITLVQGVIAYAIISFGTGVTLSPSAYLAGLGVQFINLVYYLTLTLMLGTLFNHRGAVIGIPLALLFFQQSLIGLAPFMINVLPYVLTVPMNDGADSIAASLMLNTDPFSLIPVLSAAGFSLLFSGVSLWVFNRQEF